MARPKIPQRKPLKQSPADSLMEAFDKELDRRGYSGSPNFPILRDTTKIKQPTKADLARMRRDEAIRKHPTTSI